LAKIPHVYKFFTKLFEFSLQNSNTFFDNIKVNTDINDKMQRGFSKFLDCLDLYLELLNVNDHSISESRIIIYGSVTLENGAIMRATSSYHNRPWFSDVAILMNSEESNEYISDQGVCYGQVF
jgi:hypothetical protein